MEEEFKYQVLGTVPQWQSGLLYRLDRIEDGGITLYSMPFFTEWIQAVRIKQLNPGAITMGPCGQVYFVDKDTCRLYSYNIETRCLELLPCITVCDPGFLEKSKIKRIQVDEFTIWILDTTYKTLKAYSRENFQVKYNIDKLNDPVDFGLDSKGHLYILDQTGRRSFKIVTYDIHGSIIRQNFDTSRLEEAAALAVGKEGVIYVIDQEYNGFFAFDKEGKCFGPLNDFGSITNFKPSIMTIDRKGNIYVADAGKGLIHQFDADGSHIGAVAIPGFSGVIHGLAVDTRGNLYASTDRGIAFFSIRQRFTREKGIYYTKTLDSGIHECRWHRLLLNRDLPPRTVLEVYYYASDDENLKSDIQDNLADKKKSAQQKAEYIRGKIYRWKGPERNPEDMLFREATGRYLWLRLELSTFDETVRPTVSRIQVYYPRKSYLRYLPAVYQEDPVSGEFLERFLSLFETQFYGLETGITQIAKYFDPDTLADIVPETELTDFLVWLGSWLNLALEEEWEEDKKREFIKEAHILYKKKGTLQGIRQLIRIYTGETPTILEHARIAKPMVLGGEVWLGINTMVQQTPIRGFRLGDSSILGRVALRDQAMTPQDPFLVIAHWFTVILNLSWHQYQHYEGGLKQILDEEKPAHTEYFLRNTRETRVGIFKVSGFRPMKIGVDSTLGTGLVVYNTGEIGGRLDRYSRIGRDLKLI